MLKVIETNLSTPNGIMADHQARIVEIENWEDYVNEIKEGKSVFRGGSMHGRTIPENARIENLKYDEFHLSCDLTYGEDGHIKTKKLCYLIR